MESSSTNYTLPMEDVALVQKLGFEKFEPVPTDNLDRNQLRKLLKNYIKEYCRTTTVEKMIEYYRDQLYDTIVKLGKQIDLKESEQTNKKRLEEHIAMLKENLSKLDQKELHKICDEMEKLAVLDDDTFPELDLKVKSEMENDKALQLYQCFFVQELARLRGLGLASYMSNCRLMGIAAESFKFYKEKYNQLGQPLPQPQPTEKINITSNN